MNMATGRPDQVIRRGLLPSGTGPGGAGWEQKGARSSRRVSGFESGGRGEGNGKVRRVNVTQLGQSVEAEPLFGSAAAAGEKTAPDEQGDRRRGSERDSSQLSE